MSPTVKICLLVFGILFCLVLPLCLCIFFLTKRLRDQAAKITEARNKLAEAEIEKMRANLLRAVSHDIRTPLTGIVGNCLAYLENGSHLEPTERDNLVRNIYDDSTWLINMVENLLTVTRIQGQNLAIKTNEESVEEVMESAISSVTSRHRNAVINATLPEEFILLPMDAILIEQVTINLLENALFHSRSEKPVELLVKNEPDCVSFLVRDHGVGIPEEKLAHLFDGSDYSGNSSDAYKGMGIGLVICKTIISAHKGTISGRNHEDGAEFRFTLPKTKA